MTRHCRVWKTILATVLIAAVSGCDSLTGPGDDPPPFEGSYLLSFDGWTVPVDVSEYDESNGRSVIAVGSGLRLDFFHAVPGEPRDEVLMVSVSFFAGGPRMGFFDGDDTPPNPKVTSIDGRGAVQDGEPMYGGWGSDTTITSWSLLPS